MNVRFDGGNFYPCKGCHDRNETCHVVCEKYKKALERTKLICKRRKEFALIETTVIEGCERRNKRR